MKRNSIKRLGIIIMSAMIAASPMVAPFTTMTVCAEELAELVDNDGEIETNTAAINNNNGTIITNEYTVSNNNRTINTNEGTVTNNNGEIETNANEGYVIDNKGTIGTNASRSYVIDNNGTIGTNEGTVTDNNGTIGTSAGNVDTNCGGATIENNYGVVGTNNGTIDNNYGIVETNQGTVENNYTTIVDGTGIVNGGTVTHQWYEVALENNTTELRIESDDEIKDKGDTTTDVFAKRAASIIIYSLNPNKIIDAVAGGLEYVKNDDGSITINDIQNPLSIVTTLVDKFFEKKPHSDTEEEDEDDNDEDDEDVIKEDPSEKPVVEDPKTPASEPEEEEGDDNDDDDVVKEDPSDKPVVEDPKTPASEPEEEEGDDKGSDDVEKEDPAEEPIEDLILEVPEILTIPTQIITPAGAIDMATVVSENPTAAIQAAKSLQNDPVVVALAQELAAQMEEVIAANKELAVKELAETPNQAVVGSAEYEAKQTAISEDLANQVASINKLTVMSLAAVQKTGVSVSTGGCNKLEAANVSLLNDLLAKGVPVTLTYAIDGASVTLKIPAGVKLTKFIGADGRLDLTKLRKYIVK